MAAAQPPANVPPVRVLVTGGAGFIGSQIADRLADAGHDVVVLDVLLPAAHGGGPPEWTDRHDFVVGDLQNAALLDGLLAGVDAVCHQAAMVGHGLSPSDAPAYAANNDLGTAVLLAAMHDARVSRLVLASSMVVYGEGAYSCPVHGPVRAGQRRAEDLDAGRYEPPCPHCGTPLEPGLVGEDAALDPRSTYAATKLAQEHLAAAWSRQTGGSVWALRYHNVYGARMPRDTPYAGVAALFRSALERGEAPTVLEDGAQRRDFVHVTDVAAHHTVLGFGTRAMCLRQQRVQAHHLVPGPAACLGDVRPDEARPAGDQYPHGPTVARPHDRQHDDRAPTRAQLSRRRRVRDRAVAPQGRRARPMPPRRKSAPRPAGLPCPSAAPACRELTHHDR